MLWGRNFRTVLVSASAQHREKGQVDVRSAVSYQALTLNCLVSYNYYCFIIVNNNNTSLILVKTTYITKHFRENAIILRPQDIWTYCNYLQLFYNHVFATRYKMHLTRTHFWVEMCLWNQQNCMFVYWKWRMNLK